MTLNRPLPTANARVVLQDIVDAGRHLADIAPGARTRLTEWSGGPLRSAPTDGSGGHAVGGHSDPTLAAVESATDSHQTIDPARQMLVELDRQLLALREAHYRLQDLIDSYGRLRKKDLRRECELCARHGGISKKVEATTAIDETAVPVARCSWHHRQMKDFGVDMCQAITLWHHQHPEADRRNARFQQLLRQYHPDAWARHYAEHAGLVGATGTWQDRTA